MVKINAEIQQHQTGKTGPGSLSTPELRFGLKDPFMGPFYSSTVLVVRYWPNLCSNAGEMFRILHLIQD